MTPTPCAWLCELVQDDGSVKAMIVEQDPCGMRFGDVGEPSPFRVTKLYDQDYTDAEVAKSVAPLNAEISELDDLRDMLADILTRTALALRGPEPSSRRPGWGDLPERAAAALVAAVAAERERLRGLVEAVRDANAAAHPDDGTFRLQTPGQDRAWLVLLAALENQK